MKEFMLSLLLLVLLAPFQSCSEENIEIDNLDDFETYLQDEMDAQNIPAMAVLIFEEVNIVYEKYLGQSNLEENKPLAQNDLFLLASVSKVVTATALLQLYDDGLFDLDDNINDYLPFNVSIPGQSTPITFKMLLTHTSGISDGDVLDSHYFYGEDSPTELAFFMENYLVPGGQYYDATDNFYDFEPGTEHEYSNVGSALLAVLVEEIANKPFNAYCKENIFQPLGMNHTFWRLDEAFQSNSTLVQPYNFSNNQFEPIQHYTFTDYPNGGLRSSARDMFTFLQTISQGGSSSNYQLLKSSTINDMIKPQISSINNEMGLHMFHLNPANGLWGHDGGEQGVATIMAFNPATKVGAIIFTNQGDADLDDILEQSYQIGLKI